MWTDDIDGAPGDAFALLDAIVDRIVASIAEQIERAESKSAMAKPPTYTLATTWVARSQPEPRSFAAGYASSDGIARTPASM